MADSQKQQQNDNGLGEKLGRRLTSRKLHITVVGLVLSTVFLHQGALSGEEWVGFVKWLFAVYVAGNAAEHLAQKLRK